MRYGYNSGTTESMSDSDEDDEITYGKKELSDVDCNELVGRIDDELDKVQTNDLDEERWSIGVKSLATALDSSDFTVQVNPDDDLDQLFKQIEIKTGLTAAQQRLIYRGRLIESKNTTRIGTNIGSPRVTFDAGNATESDTSHITPTTKIKDIAGLTDGHTIHLVERKSKSTPENNNSQSSHDQSHTASNSNNGAGERENDDNGTSGSGAASLLAAILGMGGGGSGLADVTAASRSDEDDDTDANDGGTVTATTVTSGSSAVHVVPISSRSANRQSWRPRDPTTRRRHLSYRLSESDLQHPDPGSMESVRQGLMTMHTMFASSNIVSNVNGEGSNNGDVSERTRFQFPTSVVLSRSPLDARRRFFRGQWIDVRDTVNQWLEATIVEIVLAEEILPPLEADARLRKNGPTTVPAADPAVSANDLSGRRRLLLEACSEEEHDPTLGIELDADGNPRFFRQRDSNDELQLLLVHYNGWPHRWDEWIRSDSERVRLFRTRTRHPSNNLHVSPTVQAPFSDSPSTYFTQRRSNITSYPQSEPARERDDRQALLPELARAMTVLNDLVANSVAESSNIVVTTNHSGLPWTTSNSANLIDDPPIIEDEEPREDDDECKQQVLDDFTTLSTKENRTSNTARRAALRSRRHELEMLAPLLERFGRVLVDAAPQIAALAASLEQTVESADDSRLSVATASNAVGDDRQPSSLGSFLSLLSRDRRRNTSSVDSSNAAVMGNDNVSQTTANEQATTSNRDDDDDATDAETMYEVQVDPDYTDFATGIVNTTRGEVRGGSRGGSSVLQTAVGSTSDELAGLLGAYLAAASVGNLVGGSDDDETVVSGANGTNAQGLGRILRERGVGGNGIDIHIHAVVTAPGGNVGLATVGGAGLSSRSRATPASTPRRVQELQTLQADDDDQGIFADLYSETPDPIDPTSPTSNNGNSSAVHTSSHPVSPLQSYPLTESLLLSEAPPAISAIGGESNLDLNATTSITAPPTLFSRNSRRSGFIATNSLSEVSLPGTVASIPVTVVEAEPTSPVSALLQHRTPLSASTLGGTTIPSNSSGQGRHSRGNVLSRIFQRRQHQD